MTTTPAARVRQLFAVMTLSLAVYFIVFGFYSYLVDSEIWAFSYARYFGEFSPDKLSLYYKPIYNFILKLIYFIKLSNLEHILVARGIFIANSLLLTFLAFRLFRQLTTSKYSPWIGILLLLTNLTWFAESYRIRSDFLAMSLSLFSLGLFFKQNKTKVISVDVFLWLGLSFLVTPKSVIWNLPILVLYTLESAWGRVKRRDLWQMIGMFFFVLGAGFYFSSFATGYRLAWNHFYSASSESILSFNLEVMKLDWIFVLDSLTASPIYWSLIFSALFLFPFLARALPAKLRRHLFIFTLLILVLFTINSPKAYYCWAALIPILMLPLVLLLDHYIELFPPRLIALAAVLVAGGFLINSEPLWTSHEGLTTYRVIEDFDRLAKRGDLVFYDSMGLLPRNEYLMNYVGMGDPVGNRGSLQTVLQRKPDVILRTSRVQRFMPELESGFLKNNYTQIDPGVWLKKSSFNPMPSRVSSIEGLSRIFDQRFLN